MERTSPARRCGVAVAGALAIGLGGCGPGAPSPQAPVTIAPDAPGVEALSPESDLLSFRRSVVADQYFWLRAKALEGEAPPPFRDALAAMTTLRQDLQNDPTAWEDLEVPLGAVRNVKELTAAYAALPVSRDVGGKAVSLREHALDLTRAMAASEAAFRSGPYREHSADVDRAVRDLKTSLLPKLDSVLSAIRSDMSLPGEPRPIVVTLVGDAPYPGIFAADARGLETGSFVRVRGLDGGALVETVLHESLHAIDELTVRTPTTAMNRLRAELDQRGIAADDSNVEMAVNTVTFAEAGSLVKRFIDPAYRPMGEKGFYTLYPPAPAIVVAWERHLGGASIDETASAIATAVAAP